MWAALFLYFCICCCCTWTCSYLLQPRTLPPCYNHGTFPPILALHLKTGCFFFALTVFCFQSLIFFLILVLYLFRKQSIAVKAYEKLISIKYFLFAPVLLKLTESMHFVVMQHLFMYGNNHCCLHWNAPFESSAAQTAPWAKLRSSVNKLRQAQIAVWETVGLLFHKEGLK